MVNEWNLRNEVLAVAQRWPLPILAFLIGSLLGWGSSYIIPSPYRSEVNLLVSYNGDAIYRNPDDYKNWQLRQLNDLATSDIVVSETLSRLRASDPYWNNIDGEQFRQMVDIFWRNTGKWRLAIDNNQASRSKEAVQIWADVYMEKYGQAKENAFKLFALDKQLQSVNDLQAQARVRRIDLNTIKSELQAWEVSAANLPGDQPLNDLERWQVWSLAARAAGFNPAWKALLDGIPAPQAPRSEYLSWLDHVAASLDQEITATENQINALDPQITSLNDQYKATEKASLGLSANVEVERQSATPTKPQAIRSTGLTALLGGILGFLAWVLLWLARPIYRMRK